MGVGEASLEARARSSDGTGSPLNYFIGELVGKVEKSIVKGPDDAFYKVSSSIAGRLSRDRALGSIIAFGVYYILNEFAGRTKEVQVVDDEDLGVS